MSKLDEIIDILKRIEAKLPDKPQKRERKSKIIDVNSPTNIIWEAYRQAYLGKWTVEPERNAMINTLILNISRRIPMETAPELVHFFLQQNDSWYLREMHHIRCLAKDCEMLLTRMKTNRIITNSKAREMEKISTNASASKEYLEAKYGGKRNV